MNLTKILTPKDTEQIRPGLFIKTEYGELFDKDLNIIGKAPMSYRQVHPAAWNGKINWKNFLLGANPSRRIVWFMIIVFVAWSYFHDVNVYKEFYEEVIADPVLFCSNVTEELNINYEDTYTIQNNYGRLS